jgi:hypothetical protein
LTSFGTPCSARIVTRTIGGEDGGRQRLVYLNPQPEERRILA